MSVTVQRRHECGMTGKVLTSSYLIQKESEDARPLFGHFPRAKSINGRIGTQVPRTSDPAFLFHHPKGACGSRGNTLLMGKLRPRVRHCLGQDYQVELEPRFLVHLSSIASWEGDRLLPSGHLRDAKPHCGILPFAFNLTVDVGAGACRDLVRVC